MLSTREQPAVSGLEAPGGRVQLQGLSKRYGPGAPAVDGVDLDVASGEFLTLLGPSGSGKTTTLAMVAGFTRATTGRVLVDGADITGVAPHRRNLGMVFQSYALFPHLTVAQNVAFPLRQRKVPRARQAELVDAALSTVHLTGLSDRKPRQLSGGQQQRVALARALVFSPSVLLMDEPLGALDRALRDQMQSEIARVHRSLGVTVLFVTHDQDEALALSDRIAVFREGRIEQVGRPEDLYDRPATAFVATFLGESNLLAGSCASGVLTARGGSRLPVASGHDGEVQLVVRPERIDLAPAGEQQRSTSDVAVLPGRLAREVYLGGQRRLEVATAEGVIVLRQPAVQPCPPVGSDVALTWPVTAAVAVPR